MWKYGIDQDVLDDNIRTIEVRNWIKYQVMPKVQKKLILKTND